MMQHSNDLSVLFDMLTYCRPAHSQTTRVFIDHFILTLPNAVEDAFGNIHVRIGESPILWSCHTDTVHHTPGRQTIHFNKATGIVQLSKRSRRTSSCLGADDTAGVWLCHQMVLAGIPGHYVFHFGEECGADGSSDLAWKRPDLINDARFAIALDRAGYDDVITRQSGGRCASDAFAESLATQLNASGSTIFEACPHGVFTDTANYTDLIPECTNLSVGYFDQHSKHESLDVRFLQRLFMQLCQIDASLLVCERDPKTETDKGFQWRDWVYSDNTLPIVSRSDNWITLAWTKRLATEIEICEYCGMEYEVNESSAVDIDKYCSADCELADFEHVRKVLTTSTTKDYLDPVYADVQRALASQKLDQITDEDNN